VTPVEEGDDGEAAIHNTDEMDVDRLPAVEVIKRNIRQAREARANFDPEAVAVALHQIIARYPDTQEPL
jgi:hypothetical protein